MYGRYSFAKDLSELATLLAFMSRAPFFVPRYNIAPRQQAPVIVLENYQPALRLMLWGLIPSWAKEESLCHKLIKARAETIFEKPSFRKPIERQRCLIPADGFYEWQRQQRELTPFRFTVRDNSIFCFAGTHDKWIHPPRSGEFEFDDLDEPPPKQVIETFSISTTSANKMAAAVHERMPVIVSPNHYLWWIDERRDGEAVRFMLRPYPAEDMECCRVSRLVNEAKNDSPDCLKPG
jgi:putative SOS response-associated peptidase YedK